MASEHQTDVALLPPMYGSRESETPETDDACSGPYGEAWSGIPGLCRRLERERNAARQDRDAWKDSAARYHTANEWLDAERSKFIAALRDIDPKHPLLPENSQINE